MKREITKKLKTFAHFPEHDKCGICGTNNDGECILIGIDGTEYDGNMKAKPFHTGCLNFRLSNRKTPDNELIIYQIYEEKK